MKSKHRTYIIIAGFSFIVGVLLYLLFFSSSQPELRAAEQPEHQRTVYPFNLERDTMFTVANETTYRGMSITSNSTSFFITDFGDNFVKQFDGTGSYIGPLGEGEGRGPGEFIRLFGSSVTEEALWVSDPRASRLTRLSLSTGESDVFPMNRPPSRVAANDSLVAVKMSGSTTFSLYDTSGNKRFDFEHPSIIPENDPIAFDGWITLSENHLLYIPRSYGAIFGFDLSSGKHIFTIPTPDDVPLPESQRLSDTNRTGFVAPTSQVTNTRFEYVKESGKLIVSVFDRGEPSSDGSYDPENHLFWLDIYDIENQSYLYSIELPHIVDSFTFLGDYFLIYSTTSAMGLSYVMDDSFKSLIFD